jgi:hypothetical protein
LCGGGHDGTLARRSEKEGKQNEKAAAPPGDC